MTDTINYAGLETYSTIQLDIRDDATDGNGRMRSVRPRCSWRVLWTQQPGVAPTTTPSRG